MTDQQESTDFNRRVGLNLQGFRKSAGLSQADLAQALSERGASFQQQTILKVEKGSRPLRLEEAALIGEILEVPLSELLAPDPALERLLRARAATERLQQRWNALAQELADVERQLEAAKTTEWEAQGRFHSDREGDHGER